MLPLSSDAVCVYIYMCVCLALLSVELTAAWLIKPRSLNTKPREKTPRHHSVSTSSHPVHSRRLLTSEEDLIMFTWFSQSLSRKEKHPVELMGCSWGVHKNQLAQPQKGRVNENRPAPPWRCSSSTVHGDKQGVCFSPWSQSSVMTEAESHFSSFLFVNLVRSQETLIWNCANT